MIMYIFVGLLKYTDLGIYISLVCCDFMCVRLNIIMSLL